MTRGAQSAGTDEGVLEQYIRYGRWDKELLGRIIEAEVARKGSHHNGPREKAKLVNLYGRNRRTDIKKGLGARALGEKKIVSPARKMFFGN